MSFLVPCPICGSRDVSEFGCAGEALERPVAAPSLYELTSYLYFRDNVSGIHREWWYHRLGCELWFLASRDTRTNEMRTVEVPSAGERQLLKAGTVAQA